MESACRDSASAWCSSAYMPWQDHATYAQVLRVTVAIVLAGTLILGITLHLSLGEYILRLGLPVLPAILDVLDIANGNETLGQSRERLSHEADRLYTDACRTGTAPSIHECRSLQDEIYTTRRIMGVPKAGGSIKLPPCKKGYKEKEVAEL
jgi:hypothetical protein